MRTYLVEKIGILGRIRELIHLYKFQTQSQEVKVAELIENMEDMKNTIEGVLGEKVEGKKILEIGPGQKTPYLYYFARSNEYLGVDLDLPVASISLGNIISMWRSNGVTRTMKTLGRWVLGIDREFEKQMCEQLKITGKPEAQLRQMDATNLQIEENSYDIVFSISVFEHLPDPKLVMKEISRVLKPGGVAYIVTHLFTSDSGIHDPKVFGEHESIPYWSHLRPDYEHLVRRNCYLNEFRLERYEHEFKQNWPKCRFIRIYNSDKVRSELNGIRERGGLRDYSDEELMTDVLITLWSKS